MELFGKLKNKNEPLKEKMFEEDVYKRQEKNICLLRR